jgi:hypothetical protein
MYSIDRLTSLNKSFSSNSNAGTVYVYSDEIAKFAIEERARGHLIDVIKQDERIKAARVMDLNLGVFVAYNGGVRA